MDRANLFRFIVLAGMAKFCEHFHLLKIPYTRYLKIPYSMALSGTLDVQLQTLYEWVSK